MDGRDVLFVVGVAGLIYGIGQWSVPAAWVCGGLLALAGWLWPHLRKG